MSAAAVTVRSALVRALRGRCPRCGIGPVFLRGFRSATACRSCAWPLERGPGHWVGGSEIHMLVTFPAGIAMFGVLALVFGVTPWTLAVGAVATLAFSLGFLRPSRCLFFAIDYLIDPMADGGSVTADDRGEGEEDGGGNVRDRRHDRPSPRGPSGVRVSSEPTVMSGAAAACRSSFDSFRAPPPLALPSARHREETVSP